MCDLHGAEPVPGQALGALMAAAQELRADRDRWVDRAAGLQREVDRLTAEVGRLEAELAGEKADYREMCRHLSEG